MLTRTTLILLLVLELALAAAAPAFAQSAPPCNDSDGDGIPSGREFAEHHIVPLATAGDLGFGGHIPGDHMGFSTCEPAG